MYICSLQKQYFIILLKQKMMAFQRITLLACFYGLILGQISTGIVNLVSLGTNANTYALENRLNASLVISISSFTSIETNNSCLTQSFGTTINISCTHNIKSFSYLFYMNNIMISSSTYTMYFFDKDKTLQANFSVPFLQTSIARPQIRVFIQEYEQINELASYLQINQNNMSSSLNIKRSLNVRKLRFTYLMIQSSPFYNLTFVTKEIINTKSIQVNKRYLLNFFGISKIAFKRQSLNQVVSLMAIANESSTNTPFSINQIMMSSNTDISAVLIQLYESISCTSSEYFSPQSNSCVKSCVNSFIRQSLFGSKSIPVCLNRTNLANASFSNDSSDSNYNNIYNFSPSGCKVPTIKEYSIVICKECKSPFVKMNDICMCGFGYYQSNQKCQQCESKGDKNCIPHFKTSINVLQSSNLDTISIKLVYHLSSINQFLIQSSILPINITINAKRYQTKAKYDKSSQSLLIIAQHIPISSQYSVQILQQKPYDLLSGFAYVYDDYGSYLWTPLLNPTIINHPISNKQIIQSIAPIFTNSQKSIPIITAVSFAIGQKINLLGIFQTVSILYLINFINLNQNLKDLGFIIKEMFIFQPKPLVKIFGSDGYIKTESIDKNVTSIDNLIYEYTKGQMYLALGLNNILVYSIQVFLLFLIIKFLKFTVSPSKNMVIPSNKYIQKGIFQIKRSSIGKESQIKWLKEPQLCQDSTFRQKLYYKVSILDQKKYIIFTSLIVVQIVGNSFLILQEILIPTYSINLGISQIIGSLVLFFIIIYPIFLINVQPLYIFKCTSIILKRKTYSLPLLWAFFYYSYIECVIFSLFILASQQGQMQTGLISLSLFLKIVFFKNYLKNIEFLKQTLMFLFFFIVFLTFYLPQTWIIQVKSALLIIILCILGCQFFKIFRSVIIGLLNLFKGKPEKQQEKKQNKLIVQVLESNKNEPKAKLGLNQKHIRSSIKQQ